MTVAVTGAEEDAARRSCAYKCTDTGTGPTANENTPIGCAAPLTPNGHAATHSMSASAASGGALNSAPTLAANCPVKSAATILG